MFKTEEAWEIIKRNEYSMAMLRVFEEVEGVNYKPNGKQKTQ